MEHEVLVPLPQQAVLEALRRPELLARCLPGFTAEQPEDRPEAGTGADPGRNPVPALAGRLKLRVGSSSITYRGELEFEPVTAGEAGETDGGPAGNPDDLVVAVRAQQSVGSGAVSGRLRVAVLPDGDEQARVLFHGDLAAKGRLEELHPEAVSVALRRLLDRFCAAMVADLADADLTDADGAVPGDGMDGDPILFAELADLEDLAELGELTDLSELADFDDPQGPDGAEDHDVIGGIDGIDESGLFLIDEPSASMDAAPFNAAAALNEPWPDPSATRRSMVGRSAEEVDHAPPSGRYGPSLPPRSARSRAAARWGAPSRRMGEPPSADGEPSRVPWVVGGGAALIGGAVILVRVLRRRG
jgi:carbon monoxide dehydrogenase subunit G